LKDNVTLAHINLFAVFGAIETLCLLDADAAKLASPKKPISIKFTVKKGPCAVFKFGEGKCEMLPSSAKADVVLRFCSCKKLNDMANGKGSPVPTKGFFKLGFVLNNFKKLGALLEGYLKAPPEKLLDPQFKELSTKLMCSVIAGALCQIANNDKIGKISASRIPNGSLSFEVGTDVALTINAQNSRLCLVKEKCASPTAVMQFDTLATARDVFDGKEDSMEAVGKGTLSVKGYYPILINLNNVLGRVGIYLK
jgi:hypothetical protein